MPKTDPFLETFRTLRTTLERNGRQMTVVTDTAREFVLASPTMVDRVGRPLFAAAVQIKKTYVSYHLMPVYMHPELLEGLSPALRKRMQGKSCFNFTTVTPAEAKELGSLTKKGLAGFKNLELPWG